MSRALAFFDQVFFCGTVFCRHEFRIPGLNWRNFLDFLGLELAYEAGLSLGNFLDLDEFCGIRFVTESNSLFCENIYIKSIKFFG